MSENDLRVLSVCCSDTYGGASRAAYRIHQGVRKSSVDSQMFVQYKQTSDKTVVALDRFVPDNHFYQTFDWLRNKIKNRIQHLRWNRYPNRDSVFMSDLRGTALHGALRKLDYDVIHLHWVNQRFIPLERLPQDKPIIWTLHDSWPFCGICHYFLKCKSYQSHCGCCPFLHSSDSKDLSYKVWRKKSEIYNKLDLHIVSPSRWLATCAKQSSLFKRFPITVIPNCVDVETFRPLEEWEISPRWRSFHERKNQKPFILYGAMNAASDKRKGYLELLFALRLLERQGQGNDFELIVFGAKESDLSYDVSVPIHYVGYVNDDQELVSLYNIAAVTVVPSLAENLSCTIMESLSCETPVVAFDIGGNGDMIDHGVSGYLAKENDPEDLAKGILWSLSNNKDNHLGVAGREKVLKDYTFNAVASKYISLYNSVLE